MKARNATCVVVSALALQAMYVLPACAQLQIACTRNFFVGEHDACSTGSLRIDPDGGTAVIGCLVENAAPAPGRCILSTLGPGPTRSVTVQFSTSSIFIKAGAPSAKVNSFLMLPIGGSTSAAKFTFTPTEVKNTVTLDIGGRLHFSDGQAIGVYTGTLSIAANLL